MVDFSEGLTAIIGSNGSGKSNLLGAIRWLVTGENPNSGTKAENICDLAPETENSYGELYFEHAGTSATVRRNLRPASPTAKLTIHTTGEEIIGDTKVTARIEEILGIDKATINDMVIVAQSEIFGFLDRTPAKRAAQFQKLFHTEKAEEVYKAIGNQLKTVQIPAVAGDMDGLRRLALDATEKIATVQTNLSGIPGFDVIKQNRESNAQCVRDFDARANLVGLRARLTTQRQQKEELKQQLVQQRAQVQADIATIAKASDGNRAAAQTARVKLGSVQQLKQQRQLREQTSATVASLESQLQTLVAPTRPADYEDAQALSERLAGLTGTKQSLEAFLASFDGETAECPTCGTPTDQLADKLETARNLLRDATNEHEQVLLTQASGFTFDQQQQRYQQSQSSLQSQLTQATQHLQSIPITAEEDVDVAELQTTIDNEKTYDEGLEELQQNLSQLTSQIGQCTGTITTLGSQVEEATQRLTQLPEYTQQQRDEASQHVTGWDKTERDRRDWETQLAIAQTTLTSTTQQLEELAAVQAEADLLTAWHELMQEIRGVVHKDAAPRFVAQRNLRRLQSHMNSSLEMFGTNYRVEADEGLSFQAYFNHGSQQPADRLSEGQKVILALAFRLALNLMFAENIGAMYLDEPTAYLDEHHIAGFEPVLSKLKEFSTSRGLQCIIITHERGLAPLFDAVVQL